MTNFFFSIVRGVCYFPLVVKFKNQGAQCAVFKYTEKLNQRLASWRPSKFTNHSMHSKAIEPTLPSCRAEPPAVLVTIISTGFYACVCFCFKQRYWRWPHLAQSSWTQPFHLGLTRVWWPTSRGPKLSLQITLIPPLSSDNWVLWRSVKFDKK